MFSSLRMALVAAAAVLAGCANHLGTEFHDLALFEQQPVDTRSKLLLPFDAYVVGVEKDNRSRVGEVAECAPGSTGGDCLDIDAPFFAARPTLRENLRGKYRDQHRPTYVTHVARFDGADAPCFLVNRYQTERACGDGGGTLAGDTLVTQSFAALKRLGDDMDRRLVQLRATHVIVYTMGWNTAQLEAMDNFRRLVGQLTKAAREADDADFRPLVIGLTWPSTGSPLLPASDFGIKAKDADEVGAVWENLLINRELRRLKERHGFRLVVIGHSFGARASSRAVFSSPLVDRQAVPIVDLLIGLQGAYSFQRYLASTDGDAPEGVEGAPYREHARQAGLVALTSSRWDSAVTRAKHGPYFVGSAEVFARTREEAYRDDFVHTSTGADGKLLTAPSCDPRRVLMIDASTVIVGNEPNTGGGAHSVIYTEPIGRLTHQLIKACAR